MAYTYINESGESDELAMRTAGGTSAVAAINVQTSPFTKGVSTNENNYNEREMLPDLFPEHVGQTKGGTTATAQTNQTN